MMGKVMQTKVTPELLQALGLETDADPAEVNAAWNSLPLEVRQAVTAIVKGCEIVIESKPQPL
jgi:hypothetical protein